MGKSEFQKAIVLQAASQIRAADLPRINAIFRTYDRDNTGYLEGAELIKALTELGIDENTARRASNAIDLDNNGKIEYTEFVAGCISMFDNKLEDSLWQIFKKLDTDGSGQLTHSEIERLLRQGELKSLGFAPSGSEIQKIIQDLDTDRSGTVGFMEFCEYINPHKRRDRRRVGSNGQEGQCS